MTIRAFALCHVLRCPPPLSGCPHCFSIHRRICLPPLLSPVHPSPHPCLMLSCHHLLLRHQHLPPTPIASLPPPAATTISFALPIWPLRLLLLLRLPRPRYHLLCIANSPPPPPPALPPPSPPLPSPLHCLLDSSVIFCFCSTIASSAALVPSSAKLKQHPN